MPPRTIRPISNTLLITAPAVAWAILATLAGALAFSGDSLPSPIHGLALAVVLAITGAAGVLWVRNLVAREHAITRAVIAALRDRIELQSPTVPLPPVVVGTAAVRPAIGGVAEPDDPIDPSTMRLLRRIDDEMIRRSDDEQ